MEKHRISPCFFPTTVLFVDDNQHFLNSLSIKLDDKKIVPKLYSDPLKALQFLEEDYEPSPFTERCILHPQNQLDGHRFIDIDVNAIRYEMYNPLRFNEISVVVVDYAMPGLSGMDLCLLVRERDPRLKILMLTGEADENIAVQAFNEGSIDKFIHKGTENFAARLNAAIYDLQQDYFNDLSEIIMSSVARNVKFPPTAWLNDPIFWQFFHKICQENHIVEYYLTDTNGSFLLLDADANPSWFAVKSEDNMRADYEMALCSQIPFLPDMLSDMQSFKKLLYVYEGDSCNDPFLARNWLHPAEILQGQKTCYYYALINNSKVYDIKVQEILPYHAFLDQPVLNKHAVQHQLEEKLEEAAVV